MLVFIDESGDPGVGTGSKYLVIAMVIFHSTADAKEVDMAIETLRQTGHHKREFKFSQVSYKTRDAFFDAIMPRSFEVKAVIRNMDKLSHIPKNVQLSPMVEYQIALNNLFHLWKLTDARIRLDGKINKKLEHYLKHHKNHLNAINPDTVKQIGMRDSKKDNLIQLADMVAGAIARSLYQDNKNSNRWRNKLKLKKSDLHYDW
ncbi:DUF3800 domain-containing protein [Alphaproteobacteria bacterium LSUCC0684]